MKAIRITPAGKVDTIRLPSDAHGMQSMVGGWFTYFPVSDDVYGIANDNGIAERLDPNPLARFAIERITGLSAAPLFGVITLAGTAGYDNGDLIECDLDDETSAIVRDAKSVFPNDLYAAYVREAVEFRTALGVV